MFRRWVGPNAAGLVMLAAAALAAALLMSSNRMSWGFAPPDPTAVDALVRIAVAWIVLMPLGRLIAPGAEARRRAPWVVLSMSASVGLALALAAALGASRWHWGYFLSPPGVDGRVLNARSVESLTFFLKDPYRRDHFYTVRGWTADDVREAATQPAPVATSEGASTDRAAIELARRGVLHDPPMELSAHRMALVFQMLRSTGKLEVEGLGGHVMEFTGRDGKPYLLVAADGNPGLGGYVSNDHLPFYEFVFTNDAGGAPPRLLSFTRFYWDNAGMEGFEWPQMFVYFAPAGLAGLTAWAVLYLLLRKVLDRWAKRQRGFPVMLVTAAARE
jgi:hypothetical protein